MWAYNSFSSPGLSLDVNSSRFISSSGLSSAFVCRSPRRTPNAHGTSRLALLPAELATCLRHRFSRFLRASGDNFMRGLLSWGVSVD
jgi:hypothetical protein